MALRTLPIKLGLLQVNVKIESTVEDSTPKFRTVCTNNHQPTPVKQRLECPDCSNDDRSTFEKAQPQEDGSVVVVTQDEAKEASKVESTIKDAINLTSHPSKDVAASTIATGRVYTLTPGKGTTAEDYNLFVELVAALKKEALCTVFAVRSRPAMYQLRVHDGILRLHELAWPQDVKAVAPVTGKPPKALVDQAKQLVSMVAAPFDPSTYIDSRLEAMDKLAQGRTAVALAGDEVATSGTSSTGKSMQDMLAAAVADAKSA